MDAEWVSILFYLVFVLMQVMIIYFYNEMFSSIYRKDKRWYFYPIITFFSLVFYALLHSFLIARLGFVFTLFGAEIDLPGGAIFFWLAFSFAILLLNIIIAIFKNLWSVIRKKTKFDKRWYGLQLLSIAILLPLVILIYRIDYTIPFDEGLDVVYIAVLAVMLAALWISMKSVNQGKTGQQASDDAAEKKPLSSTHSASNHNNTPTPGNEHYDRVISEYNRLQSLGDYTGQISLLLKETGMQTDASRKANIWNLLGLAYKNLGDDARSLECYQTAAQFSTPSSKDCGAAQEPHKTSFSKKATVTRARPNNTRTWQKKSSPNRKEVIKTILFVIGGAVLFYLLFLSPDDSGTVSLPSHYTVIDGRIPANSIEQFNEALLRMDKDICFRGDEQLLPVNWPDIMSSDYTHFWVKSFTYSELKQGRFPGEKQEEPYRLYHFEYYDLNPEQISEMKREIEAETQDILSMIPAGANEWEAARVIHNEMIKRITYDQSLSAPYNFNAYGALVRHSAICCGYSVTYKYLLLRYGILADAIESDDHSWNYLFLPATDPFVDVTWDDQDLVDADGNPYILYNYFFLSNEEAERLDSHTIKTFVPSMNYLYDNLTSYNYYAHEGYLMDHYDQKECEHIFRQQLGKGNNVLTVRFVNEEDYQKALGWTDNNYETFFKIMNNVGYNGSTMTTSNDTLRIINIYLNAPNS